MICIGIPTNSRLNIALVMSPYNSINNSCNHRIVFRSIKTAGKYHIPTALNAAEVNETRLKISAKKKILPA